jgi:Ca-activated chloride channel homolog
MTLPFEWTEPWWLLLFAFWPLGYLWRKRAAAARPLVLPTAPALAAPPTWRIVALRRLPWLLHLAAALLVLAMARPQKVWQEAKSNSNGIDIMLVLDISLSMLCKDFEPNRLAVSKNIAKDFVDKRPNDRIGLVVFAGEAFTHCPLTSDKRVVKEFIDNVKIGVLEWKTAIGDGLATALNQLNKSTAKSKIVVLLTDGDNNATKVASPTKAAEIAANLGIKVYTIAIGEEGIVPTPYAQIDDSTFAYQMAESHIQTDTLEAIAERTNARFFRAYTPQDLEEIYGVIDLLEKSEIETATIRRSIDYFQWLVWPALLLLLAYVLLKNVVLRSVLE